MPNIVLRPMTHASSFRRIAAVAWDEPRDPSIYGTLQVRAEPLLAWIAAQNAEGGEKVTLTHAVARAVAIAIDRHRDVNAIVRWGRLYLREDVDIFLQVLVKREGGEADGEATVGQADLSGVVVRKADTKDVRAIAREVREGARRIRSGTDEEFKRTKDQARTLPAFLLRWGLRLIEFLQYQLNVDTTFLGAPRDPFGSALVTSVGMLGIRLGYAPFFPLARTPLLILVGAVEDAVVPENGVPVVGKVLTLNATCDHRVIDGYHAAVLSREIREVLEEPGGLERP